MPIKKNLLTYCPSSTTVSAIVILLALAITLPSAHASGPWVEVQPPFVEEGELDVGIIHFIDAETGWAVGSDFILRTTDGDRVGAGTNCLTTFPADGANCLLRRWGGA